MLIGMFSSIGMSFGEKYISVCEICAILCFCSFLSIVVKTKWRIQKVGLVLTVLSRFHHCREYVYKVCDSKTYLSILHNDKSA